MGLMQRGVTVHHNLNLNNEPVPEAAQERQGTHSDLVASINMMQHMHDMCHCLVHVFEVKAKQWGTMTKPTVQAHGVWSTVVSSASMPLLPA
jgi:hypothetical protein